MTFDLIEEDLHYLHQQRTQYAGMSLEETQKAYFEEMRELLETVRNHLPSHAGRCLDVGGGLGGMTIMLNRHYATDHRCEILERHGDHGSKIGWHNRAGDFGVYNSINLTRLFLARNGMFPMVWNANKEPFPDGPFGLITSFLSLGFHYPVTTYLEKIYEQLRPDGVLILDIRHGSGGEELCAARFGNSEVIKRGTKSNLYKFVK